jgi:2-polyprenyl-3-methyl-5-hydroxy-6-metoxy-1,4-benzoquinol methylase
MDINLIASHLELKDGVWYSKNKSSISYPETGNENCLQIEKDSFWFKHRNRCISKLVSRLSPDEIFFDIGGGNGYVSKGLQEEGIKTVLLEPGEKGVANAKNRGVTTIICATLENAGLKNESLGAVGLFDVVEHIENDQEFLIKIHEHLKTNGLVFITVPAFGFLWSQADVHAGHYRRYSLGTLNRLLKRTGFDIVYSTYFFALLPLPIFFLRSIPSLFGKDKNHSVEKRKDEHRQGSFLQKFINQIWEWEFNKINSLKKINFGSSCLVVARKKT